MRNRVVHRIKSKAKEIIQLRWQIKEQLWKYKLYLMRTEGSTGELWAAMRALHSHAEVLLVFRAETPSTIQWRYMYRIADTEQKNNFCFSWMKKLYILHTVFMCEFLCLHRDSEPEERAGCSESSFLQLLPSQTIKLLLTFSGSTACKSFLPSMAPLVWWKVWEIRKVK